MKNYPHRTVRLFARVVSVLLWPMLAPGIRADSLSDQFQIRPLTQIPSVSYAATAGGRTNAPDPRTDPQIGQLTQWLQGQVARARQTQAAGAGPAVGSQPVATPQQALEVLRQTAGPGVQVRFRPQNGTPIQIKGAVLQKRFGLMTPPGLSGEEYAARAFLRNNRALLRLEDPDTELVLKSREREDNGRLHLRFSQAYKGLPVWPDELSAHLDANGQVYMMDGAFIPTPAGIATEPTITAQQAIEVAKARKAKDASAAVTQPELVIHGLLDRPPRLAWKFELSLDAAHAWRFVIDAVTGNTLDVLDLICHEAVNGSGVDGLGQTRTLKLWHSGNSYFMVDTSKSSYDPASTPPNNARGAIVIYNSQHKEINDKDAVPMSQSASPTTGWDADAVDAAFGLSETYDYYLERHARNSLDAHGGSIIGFVHFGQAYANAFWSSQTRTMQFGDGFTKSIDVNGHELTHGVINNTGDGGILEYHDQSGALNESFADIYGEMVEARTFSRPDWLKGAQLGLPGGAIQNYVDPHSRKQGGITNPAKMSEFVNLDRDQDNGGVHINSSIINHAYYLLAEGLNGAVGIRDAERIFYRAMTLHLQKESQFIDMRLAAIVAAEELFNKDSVQAQKTAEAFDAVEITDAPSTPTPSPIPTVQGPDSTLALRLDPLTGQYYLVRREPTLNDPMAGTFINTSEYLKPKRVSVSGNGSFAVFVTVDNDVGFVTTDGTEVSFADMAGLIHNVAAAPDGNHYAVVVLDQITGLPTDEIMIIQLEPPKGTRVKLYAPGTEGAKLDIVQFADSMAYMSDSQTLIYDAFCQIPLEGGQVLSSWTLYELDTAKEIIGQLITLSENLDFGNPSVGHTRDNLLTFEVIDKKTGNSTVFASDLASGNKAEIGQIALSGAIGIPGFTGDDTAIVYAQYDQTVASEFSLVRQPLAADRITPNGQPALWMSDADLGVIYRRGTFVSSNALPVVQLQNRDAGRTLTAPATLAMAATASDPDGQVAKVEFYYGSVKAFEVTSPPFNFQLTDVPAGEYVFRARAIDNLGGAGDSDPVKFIVNPAGSAAPPVLKVGRAGNEIRISWPITATGFVLQSTDRLASPTLWNNVAVTPTAIEQENVTTILLGTDRKFYRLLKP